MRGTTQSDRPSGHIFVGLTALVITLPLLINACSSTEAAPSTAPTCPTFDYTKYQARAVPVTLAADVRPILQRSCSLSTSCHGSDGATRAQEAPSLGPVGDATNDDFSRIQSELVNRPSRAVPSRVLVSPGSPQASFLMNKLEGNQACSGFECSQTSGCGVRMPQASDPLDAAEVALIRDWIAQGAL